MKVRALISFAGMGFSYSTGQVFDLPPGRERWLSIGWVVPLERETAALEPPERAEMPRPKRKRAGSSK